MTRSRAEMIEATRAKLLATARQAFREAGYAATSMDDFTAAAGLTRGALYHHFGDKKGLLAAVVEQIDGEMDQRLAAIAAQAPDAWAALHGRCRAYLEMAAEPEIRRIVLQDARAVLGAVTDGSQQHCIASLAALLQTMMDQDLIEAAAPQALARLINGSLVESAFWIAQDAGDGPRLAQALQALDLLLRGLLKH
ncbi:MULTISPECIES: TetR/AcrR family transcriptional regulator [Achromobacter]|uniref:TetR/AcrR family transcriptional regulator n=1 Tax=Alcaligenes xylosoxydans xylosoxydans TaxID=85698 RepID=A0A424WDV0_ALCXX|nr:MULTISPECIES: TetR/AcrR family transcriptional regulator [Achromobacter]MBC9903419.1 TetR/AcrR family transcriptional regulator [Achromobacter xylosoxidans]MBD0867302.1 TetR/AcrR family transcriptional regulator [Achromobacter xylosoxidans]QNP88327.1 TetR/AcrR family transcriptional regulator [Achromobacter xylosoxidans]RPJ91422.1 TetR/AcrR family transcriptional regulator [Achromobacter xylosoxidans]WLW64334.1 helix-turn-helix domain-containing protein [Achromobacter aegrifaciens]